MTYIIKAQNGAAGYQRETFDGAMQLALDLRPTQVYRRGAPDVRLAVVHVDGGIDFTDAGAAERRSAEHRRASA